jgi:putative membrane protein
VIVGRTIVNALATALVVWILPGIRVSTAHPVVAFLVIAVLLGLVNAFVKPAMQFVALPLLLGSLGFVVILVDVLVFVLVYHLTPLLSAEGPGSVVAAGILLGLFAYILDNLAGLAPPIVSDRPASR